MNKHWFVILVLFISGSAFAQSDSLNLSQCQQWAREHYPLLRQKEMLQQTSELKVKNISKNWYPQLYLNAQATYQSDVTTVTIPFPGIEMPETDKDMYKVTLDVSQTLWDGGVTAGQKDLEQISLLAEQQGLEIELYKVQERVNLWYFNVLLCRENIRQLNQVKEELQSKVKKAEAARKNEAALQVTVDILHAEMLKIDQQIIEARAGEQAALNMLKEITGQDIAIDTKLSIPPEATVVTGEILRPELRLFDLQIEKLEAGKKISTSRLMPRISVFGQAGYGKPGLNMLESEFTEWYLAGVKLSWNIWNWNVTSNEKKIIDVQQDIVLTQKETFEMNTRVIQQRDQVEILKYDELIAKDKEIVELREKIAQNYSVQFDNGIITATEYTTELNAAAQARITMQLHQLQKRLAMENYKINSGTIKQ